MLLLVTRKGKLCWPQEESVWQTSLSCNAKHVMTRRCDGLKPILLPLDGQIYPLLVVQRYTNRELAVRHGA